MSNCPFCGVATDTPHETQEGCISALNAEIARMRAILEHVHSTEVPGPPDPPDPVDRPDDTLDFAHI
jgi:hypothetical protein